MLLVLCNVFIAKNEKRIIVFYGFRQRVCDLCCVYPCYITYMHGDETLDTQPKYLFTFLEK